MNMNNNDMLFDTQSGRARMPICDTTITTEISNDYTLPDYQAEIRRILHVGASVTPLAKYISGAGAEFNGSVDYNILYIGADGELYSVPIVGEFEFNVPIETDGFDFNEGVADCTDVTVENITTRLTGPRKFNIKCRLRSHVRAYAVLMMDARKVGDVTSDSIESLMGRCEICVPMRGRSDTLDLSEEIIPDRNDCRVVLAQGKAFISDVSAKEGEAVAKGEVYIKLLVSSEGLQNEITQITRRVPFVHTVEIEDLKSGSECCAEGYVNNISVSVEDGRIICDMEISVDVEAQNSTEYKYVCDSYSTQKESEASYKKYSLPTCGFCVNGNFSMNERLSKENLSFPDGATIVDIYGNAIADTIECNGSKNTVIGSAKYTLIILNNGEYSSMDIVLPAKYEFEGHDTSICSTTAELSVISCKARHDSDSVCIDAEISVRAVGLGNQEITALSEVCFGEALKKTKGTITVCYPIGGDTIWSVAKKYHVPAKNIDLLNGTNGSIDNSEYLII